MKERLLETLGLAEIYLQDGAPITALQQIQEAMRIVSEDFFQELTEGEDIGDVSTHILKAAGVRRPVC